MKKNEIELHIQQTLSFYDALTVTQIIYDADMKILKAHPEFTEEKLLQLLKEMEKQKIVIKKTSEKGDAWLRVMPKKPWWKKIFL